MHAAVKNWIDLVLNKYSAQREAASMPKNIEDYVCVIDADGIGEPD